MQMDGLILTLPVPYLSLTPHFKTKVIGLNEFLHGRIHHLYKDVSGIGITGYHLRIPFDFWFRATAADGKRNGILEMEGDHWG